MKKLNVAIVGATGAVGRELLKILKERDFPVSKLKLFASERSRGKNITFRDQTYPCEVLDHGCFAGVDIAFFDASDAISKEWVPEAIEAGAWVVDNSATYRMEEGGFLLVPEVNGHLLEKRLEENKNSLSPMDRVISGPNCSTVQLVVALKPILTQWGLKRVVVSSYQSTSGAGTSAMEELQTQIVAVLKNEVAQPRAFNHPIAYNCIPQIGGFKSDDYTTEETKIMEESRKILGLPHLKISATAVRVPTLSAHGETVNVETDRPFTIAQVKAALAGQGGVIVQDDPARSIYPMGLSSPGSGIEAASGRDAVYVGRIRKDPSVENGLNLWVVSDNLRKGAALNAVQIGEILLRCAFC